VYFQGCQSKEAEGLTIMTEIAIVGMSCQYPDAHSPQELWENVLARRQAFRRFPSERLRLEEYFCPDPAVPDTTYASEGAFIEGYEFDRVRFRISGSSYRSSDLTHWLALDIASQALSDAGFRSPDDLPSTTTGVIVGNTLTGEFARANGLRYRWPYVRRVVEAALRKEGWSREQCQSFLKQLETAYKLPFAPPGEETLAGSLSNTIAGRICNYFNLKGGGYTVDGACASSLLAIATACSALTAGELDLALAGGVDLSLDPFELIGFAKTAALATKEMYIYDLHSNGFFPGEGCGFVVLMRYEDALAQQRRIYALIRGWGISSDGSGGITRPDVDGQLLALARAYQKAGIGIDSVTYFEGHGTGTQVGDATELQVICQALRKAQQTSSGGATLQTHPAIIGSVKANIGHTKAAAGVAGVIKASMALSTQVIPPTTGTKQPHPELTQEPIVLMTREAGDIWPADLPLRAGVSAMGFGGINTHLLLEGCSTRRRSKLTKQERLLLTSAQDAELILLAGRETADVQQQIAHLLSFSARLSRAEITDLAVHLTRTLTTGPVRVAIVASSPTELTHRLQHAQTLLDREEQTILDQNGGVFIGRRNTPPRLGFLFSGQGSPGRRAGGLLRRRFAVVDDLYSRAALSETGDEKETAIAQPTIVTASLAALRVLEQLEITAEVGVGHSLGELTALHWAGAIDEETLLQLATVRGSVMSTLGAASGTMVSIQASRDVVEGLLKGEDVVIAGLNSPSQTVISGNVAAVATVVARARAQQIQTVSLQVSHAFHSPLVAQARRPFADFLANKAFRPLQRPIISTVTGSQPGPECDLKALLCEQITAPVLFAPALDAASSQVDLFLEVGPGKILSGLVHECVSTPAIAIDASGPSLKGLLHAVGAAFALGVPVNTSFLAEQRFSRPFDLDWQPRFFSNPCERAPLPEAEAFFAREGASDAKEPVNTLNGSDPMHGRNTLVPPQPPLEQTSSSIDLIRQLVAQRAELPIQTVDEKHRMLSDLHLNSITVGQIVSEAARALGLLPPTAPTEYADATVAEIAQALEELKQTGTLELEERLKTPAGIDAWIRTFQIVYTEKPLSSASQHVSHQAQSSWKVLAPPAYSFAEDLSKACAELKGAGVLVCLPSETGDQHISLLLQGIQEVLRSERPTTFVLVQHDKGSVMGPLKGDNPTGSVAGVARTLALEAPRQTVCVVDVPPTHPQAIAWVLAEIEAAHGYSEAVYDAQGTRLVPTLQLFPLTDESIAPLALDSSDVLLVIGGGKGIAAECALALALETGVRLALLGRSHPSKDRELAENLKRFAVAEIDFCYISADVTRADEVRQAVSEIEERMGVITAVLHGAGTNTPRLLSTSSEDTFMQTLEPKVAGFKHVLSAIQPEKLRLLVTFGSVIARTGMRGEADYALANDWLASLTEQFQAEHPACRCLCLEWSVWAGVGMGERLGRIEALIREGIMPISVDKGISCFRNMLNHRLPDVRMIVTSRFGSMPTLQMPSPVLPFLRFLEQPLIYYPGIELVTDVEIATSTDLYLEDHKFRGERLLPAVVGLEAMAQGAMAVTGHKTRPRFEQVQFTRPIVAAEKAPLKIRLAMLVAESGDVDVVLRSEETGFQIDHFRATCCFTPQSLEKLEQLSDLPTPGTERCQLMTLDPRHDLYGNILFHQGIFQRLQGYIHLRATECVAEILPYTGERLFAHYLPSELVLGDFVARDAVIHCIQACIPHGQLLPIAVEQISFAPDLPDPEQPLFVYAREYSRVGDLFTYDVEVRTTQGQVREQWRGLQLRQVEALPAQEIWHEALLGPYMERKLSEFLPAASIQLVVGRYGELERHTRSNLAFGHLLGSASQIHRRPDGKPTSTEWPSPALSASHHARLTLAIASLRSAGCDIETIACRSPQLWQDLLGPEQSQLAAFLASQTGEDLDTTATRLWAASECLQKAGAMVNAPLRFGARKGDGWILLKAGSFLVVTYVTRLQREEDPIAFAICSTVENSAELERAIRY